MDIRKFNPYVRFCSEVMLSSDYQKASKAYDFRLFYVLYGGFNAVFDDRTIEVREGDVLVFPPNTTYRLLLTECGKSNHIIINFDFVSDNVGTGTRQLDTPENFKHDEIYSTECTEEYSGIFYLKEAFFCADMLSEMCKERRASLNGLSEMLSADMKRLLIKLSREKERRQQSKRDAKDTLCDLIKEYIKKEYGSAVSNSEIAAKFGYHPYYVNSVFKKRTGYTIRAYLIEFRLKAAIELLLSTELTVAEIGTACGFNGASYFSECFSTHLGITPTEFREKAK